MDVQAIHSLQFAVVVDRIVQRKSAIWIRRGLLRFGVPFPLESMRNAEEEYAYDGDGGGNQEEKEREIGIVQAIGISIKLTQRDRTVHDRREIHGQDDGASS